MVNFNGDLLPSTAHFLNASNRGLRFGDAISETLRYSYGSFLFWEDHYFGLMASMRQLRMAIPMSFTMEFLEAEFLKTLEASGLMGQPALIRITVFREAAGQTGYPAGEMATTARGDSQPAGATRGLLNVRFIVEVESLADNEYQLHPGPRRADLFRDYYLQASDLSRICTNNQVLQVLGGIYASENGLDTCLLLNHKKEVAQALEGNLFVRQGDVIRTPGLESGCSDGILRKQLLQAGSELGPYRIETGEISPFELQQASELFVLDNVMGLFPITEYRKASYTGESSDLIINWLNNRAFALKPN